MLPGRSGSQLPPPVTALRGEVMVGVVMVVTVVVVVMMVAEVVDVEAAGGVFDVCVGVWC